MRLDELLDDALRTNPGTRRAWQEAHAARRRLGRRARALSPARLRQRVGGRRRANEVNGKQPPVDAVREPGIAIDYLLFDFGRREAAVESARQLLFAANWRYDQNIQDVLLRVAAAYYALVGRRALVAADEESLADARLVLRAADERLKVGTGTIVDVYQARAGVARIELDLATDRGAVENARGALATAVGWPANTRLDVADVPRDVPLELVEEDVDGSSRARSRCAPSSAPHARRCCARMRRSLARGRRSCRSSSQGRATTVNHLSSAARTTAPTTSTATASR